MVSALHIILTILKILGIVILIILGIALVLLLMVLFIPIRYKAKGQFEGMDIEARADATWLFSLIHFRAVYTYSKPLHIRFKVLGIPFYDNLREKKVKKSKASKEPDINFGDKEDKYDTDEDEEDDEYKETVTYAKIDEQQIEYEEPPKQEKNKKVDEIPKDNAINKIKIKISGIFNKIAGVIKKIKFTFTRICDNIKIVNDCVKYYLKLWNLESTKAAFEQCKRQICKLIKLVCPRKYRINLHLGFGDPAEMGEVLAIWGMLYPLHMGRIDIKPEFETTALDGNFKLKGHICIISVIKVAFILYFDKNIKLLIKRLKRGANISREVEYGR
jgi:hypothetical protein